MQTLSVKTKDEMTEQLTLLLNNGYDVGIHQETGLFGDVSYLIAYQKPKCGKGEGE